MDALVAMHGITRESSVALPTNLARSDDAQQLLQAPAPVVEVGAGVGLRILHAYQQSSSGGWVIRVTAQK